MANGDEETSRPAPITPRNVWEAIDRLRDETRESRHNQANLTQRAIGELEAKLDSRLRIIETMMAQANPVSLGPRLNVVEMKLAVADGDTNLATRLNAMEGWRDEQRGQVAGVQSTVRWAIGILGALGVVANLLAFVALNRPA